MNDHTAPETPRTGSAGPSGPARLVGVAIAIVGLGFAVYAVYAARDELTGSDLEVPAVLAAIGVGVGGMFVVGANWLRILRALGAHVPPVGGMRWYYVGQLGKYIPGGLWAVLGRGELAARGGVPRSVAYPSVAMSLITTYAAAAATGALFLALGTGDAVGKAAWVAGSVAMIGLTVVGLSQAVVGRLNALLRRFGVTRTLPSSPPRLSITAVVFTMPAWALIGTATGLSATALGIPYDLVDIVAATAYSWLAGFLVIPLPGGLGVREAVFIGLWSGTTAEAAAIAVVARVVFVIVDLTGAGISTVAVRVVGRSVSGTG